MNHQILERKWHSDVFVGVCLLETQLSNFHASACYWRGVRLFQHNQTTGGDGCSVKKHLAELTFELKSDKKTR